MLDNQHASTGPSQLPGRVWLDVETPCQNHDAGLWFSETADGLARAKRLCRGCALRTECLAGALARREPWGVWGGELFDRGVPVATKRPPGRPRKHDGGDRQVADHTLIDAVGHQLDGEPSVLATGGATSGTAA